MLLWEGSIASFAASASRLSIAAYAKVVAAERLRRAPPLNVPAVGGLRDRAAAAGSALLLAAGTRVLQRADLWPLRAQISQARLTQPTLRLAVDGLAQQPHRPVDAARPGGGEGRGQPRPRCRIGCSGGGTSAWYQACCAPPDASSRGWHSLGECRHRIGGERRQGRRRCSRFLLAEALARAAARRRGKEGSEEAGPLLGRNAWRRRSAHRRR